MGAQLMFDVRRPELLAAIMDGKLGDLPEDAVRPSVSLRAPRGLTQGQTWACYFDASGPGVSVGVSVTVHSIPSRACTRAALALWSSRTPEFKGRIT